MTNTDKTVSTERLEGLLGSLALPIRAAVIQRPDLDDIKSALTELLAARTQEPAEGQVEALERFEITHKPNVGMIHRPHPHGYYVRYEQAASLLRATPPAPERSKEEVPEDWRDDPSSDERWNEGVNYAITQLCAIFGVDPKSINWDAATETLDGDVCSVLCNVLVAAYGDEWTTNPSATAAIRAALTPSPIHKGEELDHDIGVWKLVPARPTPDMIKAGKAMDDEFLAEPPEFYTAEAIYNAMVEAAPKSPFPVPLPVTVTVDEVERIILETEPAQVSDKSDKIWTRRMTTALAARLSALSTGEQG